MIKYLLSLPHISWKVRLLFVGLAVILIVTLEQQWPNIHNDFAISRWIAWLLMVFAIYNLPRVLIVIVFGRLPHAFARLPGSLNKTFAETRAEIAKENKENRKGSREL